MTNEICPTRIVPILTPNDIYHEFQLVREQIAQNSITHTNPAVYDDTDHLNTLAYQKGLIQLAERRARKAREREAQSITPKAS